MSFKAQHDSNPKIERRPYSAMAGSTPATVKFQDVADAVGQKHKLEFGQFFLRENCQCSGCIHPDTKQRAADTFAVSEDVHALSFESKGEALEVKWSDEHLGIYPWKWLRPHKQNSKAHATVSPATADPKYSPPPVRTFVSTSLTTKEYPTVSYEGIMSDESHLRQWVELIWEKGYCFVSGVPVTPEATQGLIERIAFIRHTHYGGFWDFTADLTFKDTAYTNEFLGAHTDNTYFTDPARLQLFHLLSHTEGQGGGSLLVDGFEAANILRAENPSYFEALIKYRHPWHTSGNEDTCIQPSAQAPVFSVHPDLNQVYQIRWNNYDRAPKVDWSAAEQQDWYSAARRYNEILQNREIWTQLEPGTALIFDNWRMMHGRSQFTGKRRMCGGYVNNDDFISRLRLLKYGREAVLNNLGNIPTGHDPENPNSIV
ncbi:hypothetical protein N7508_009631 [Penicillium antarcticum]|uniref:uncharacterized protein n=1 Tax=Penicillium antarcticum TaxID=416450 RepID=UPI00238C42AC|nr:uncharacterized protein N7508_009631 [Penicillium antarcticum]KAJ5294810.1 hypothetical protein N7508_009631 [Penicillium antarcticum]